MPRPKKTVISEARKHQSRCSSRRYYDNNISTVRKEKKDSAREKAATELIARNGIPKRRLYQTPEQVSERLLRAREYNATYREKNRELLRRKARKAYVEAKELQAWREGICNLASETEIGGEDVRS